jgi:hypothetical protein
LRWHESASAHFSGLSMVRICRVKKRCPNMAGKRH